MFKLIEKLGIALMLMLTGACTLNEGLSTTRLGGPPTLTFTFPDGAELKTNQTVGRSMHQTDYPHVFEGTPIASLPEGAAAEAITYGNGSITTLTWGMEGGDLKDVTNNVHINVKAAGQGYEITTGDSVGSMTKEEFSKVLIAMGQGVIEPTAKAIIDAMALYFSAGASGAVIPNVPGGEPNG